MKPKKFTFGKMLTLIALLLFIATIAWCLISGENETIDAAVVAATGSLAVTSLVSYLKKSQAENLAKLDIVTFGEMAKIRLDFNEGMLKLQQKYKVDEAELDSLEEKSDMDEVMEGLKDRVVNDLNNFTNDSHSLDEKINVD